LGKTLSPFRTSVSALNEFVAMTTGFPTAEAEAAAEAAVQKVVCGYDPPPLQSYPVESVVIVGRKRRSDTREVDLKIKIQNKKPRLE